MMSKFWHPEEEEYEIQTSDLHFKWRDPQPTVHLYYLLGITIDLAFTRGWDEVWFELKLIFG